jgi:hypothetical protein
VKSTPKFVPSFNYHKEEGTIKSTKTHYSSSPKSSFNPKREVRKQISKPREEAFVCMFCGRVDHLDEFCFHRKRIENRRFDYARNSYHDEFIHFPSLSYSCAPSCFSHGPNHCSYDFGSRENNFVTYALVTAHVLIVVIISHVDPVFLLEGLTLTLSPDTWTVHIFPVMVHVPLGQMVKC